MAPSSQMHTETVTSALPTYSLVGRHYATPLPVPVLVQKFHCLLTTWASNNIITSDTYIPDYLLAQPELAA